MLTHVTPDAGATQWISPARHPFYHNGLWTSTLSKVEKFAIETERCIGEQTQRPRMPQERGAAGFYVMCCSKIEDLLLSQVIITKETGQTSAGFISKDGAALKEQLPKTDILRSENRVEC